MYKLPWWAQPSQAAVITKLRLMGNDEHGLLPELGVALIDGMAIIT